MLVQQKELSESIGNMVGVSASPVWLSVGGPHCLCLYDLKCMEFEENRKSENHRQALFYAMHLPAFKYANCPHGLRILHEYIDVFER